MSTRVAPAGIPLRAGATPTRASWVAWTAPVLALALWSWAMAVTDITALGSYGLIPRFPLAWWAALVVLVASSTYLVQRPRVPHLALLGHLGVLVLVLFGSAPALEAVPRYTYTYKHIAITQYIELYGSVDPAIDIYHRWPGFFSLSAWFSQVAGLPDPSRYAAWSELYFAVLDALLVWAAAQAVTRSVRMAWSAALLFTTANWVGQNYYSPQAFGLVLMLGVLLLCLLALRTRPGPVGRWLERVVIKVFRVHAEPVEPVDSTLGVSAARILGLILLMDAVLAASHQLTPYVLLMQLGILVLLGLLRPWWTVLGAGAVTVGYLLPNFGFVVKKFGLFSAPDPLANATASTFDGTPDSVQRTISVIAAVTLLFVFGVAFAGMVRHARRGHVRDALVVAVLAFSPPLMLVAQSYGGEARLRVFLYALPWCCAAIGWVWSPSGQRLRTRRALLVPGLAVGGLVASFSFLFFGREDINLLTPDEVGAAAYLFAPSSAKPGAVVMLVAPNFPARYGPLYFRQALTDLPVLTYDGFGSRPLLFPSQADAEAAAEIIESKGGSSGFLVFSQGQEAYARDYALYAPHALRAFEGQVAQSPRFRLVYNKPTARVYALVPRSP